MAVKLKIMKPRPIKMKLQILFPKTINEAIDSLQTFFECDMWSKIYPVIKRGNKNWQRTDYFKSEEEFFYYINAHFDILRKEIKEIMEKR